jgi:hypothetical protein
VNPVYLHVYYAQLDSVPIFTTMRIESCLMGLKLTTRSSKSQVDDFPLLPPCVPSPSLLSPLGRRSEPFFFPLTFDRGALFFAAADDSSRVPPPFHPSGDKVIDEGDYPRPEPHQQGSNRDVPPGEVAELSSLPLTDRRATERASFRQGDWSLPLARWWVFVATRGFLPLFRV